MFICFRLKLSNLVACSSKTADLDEDVFLADDIGLNEKKTPLAILVVQQFVNGRCNILDGFLLRR